MDKMVYDTNTGEVNCIVLADDAPPELLADLGYLPVPDTVLGAGVLDVGHIYNPATFDATDPATYDPENGHYPGPTPA